jgi:hypothetical protein
MTGRLRTLTRPYTLIRLAVFPLLALVALLVTGDSAHAAFNPVSTSVYCADGSGDVNSASTDLPVSCTPDISPGSHPDIVSTFNVPAGDYNFGGVVNFSPTVPDDAAIPVGAILGKLGSVPTLGLLNSSCNNGQLLVPFTFLKGSTDNNENNLVYPQPFGQSNDLAVMSGDNNGDGAPETKPPPVVTKYPSFLNSIFDPDWVNFGDDKISGNADDTNGPAPPIKPVFRAVGATSLSFAGNLWVVLQLVVFDKGTKLPALPPFDPAYGYPSVVVLQTSSAAGSATPPAPSAVSDFCTQLKTANVSYGVTKDNPDTGPNEGGVPVRTLPAAGAADACQQVPPGPGCIVGFAYGQSQRDADNDGYENSLDPCPFHPDTAWNPRDNPPIEGDSDVFGNQPTYDGIPDTCDPTTPATCATPIPPRCGPDNTGGLDHDDDGFINRGDNCPLVYNADQKDSDKVDGEEVGDGIGDACDTAGTDAGTDCKGILGVGGNCITPLPIPARGVAGKGPDVPDGEAIFCIKVNTAVVGGDPNVAFSDCLTALPPLDQPLPPTSTDPNNQSGGASTTSNTNTGGTGSTGAGSGAAGGVGGPSSGIGSLSPVAGTVPAWAAIAAGLGAAGLIGSLGTLASRLVRRRDDD